MKRSPLLISSMECIAHSTELISQKNKIKYKFVILHLANAIELILKAKLIEEGKSIYINNKSQTLSVWETINQLSKIGVEIEERPIFELLFDDRNTLQHRFGYPNLDTVEYYFFNVISFFKRFLFEEFNTELQNELKIHLENRYYDYLGFEQDIFEYLNSVYNKTPTAAVLETYNEINKELINQFNLHGIYFSNVTYINFSHPSFVKILRILIRDDYLHENVMNQLHILSEVRKSIVSHPKINNELNLDLKSTFSLLKELLKGVRSAIADGYFNETIIKELFNF
ncbi:hypothetical protein [Paucisalibacillus sp. EB02]|uniref:hypothetical protein n=1 Tax=Paucisalibacillus sp. EB02 TaxID=1347087 RepID=UPI0004BAA144|nr:hypothetical protein [Paucisalibacillus sp. EB02]